MSWTDALHIKTLNQKKTALRGPFWHDDTRLPGVVARWSTTSEAKKAPSCAMLHSLNDSHPDFGETLRQFVWRRRFRQLITSAEPQLRDEFVTWFRGIRSSSDLAVTTVSLTAFW